MSTPCRNVIKQILPPLTMKEAERRYERRMSSMYVREVAEILGVKPSTVNALVRQGRLFYLPREEWPNGRCALIDRSSVFEYLRTRRRHVGIGSAGRLLREELTAREMAAMSQEPTRDEPDGGDDAGS